MQFVHENSYVLRSMVSPSLTLSVSSVLHSLYLRCTLLTGNSSRLTEPLTLHSLPPCPGAGRPLAPAWPSCWPSWPRQTAVGERRRCKGQWGRPELDHVRPGWQPLSHPAGTCAVATLTAQLCSCAAVQLCSCAAVAVQLRS